MHSGLLPPVFLCAYMRWVYFRRSLGLFSPVASKISLNSWKKLYIFRFFLFFSSFCQFRCRCDAFSIPVVAFPQMKCTVIHLFHFSFMCANTFECKFLRCISSIFSCVFVLSFFVSRAAARRVSSLLFFEFRPFHGSYYISSFWHTGFVFHLHAQTPRHFFPLTNEFQSKMICRVTVATVVGQCVLCIVRARVCERERKGDREIDILRSLRSNENPFIGFIANESAF